MKSVRYKLKTSIAFGLAGFCLNFYFFQLGRFAVFEVTLFFGMILPLMIALVWGWKYGLLSVAAGGGLPMWWCWALDGYGTLSSTFFLSNTFQGKLFFLGCCVSVLLISLILSWKNKIRMALEASEKMYRTILETTSEGYWRLDVDTRTVEVNDAMCAMLGYEREEILGKSPLAFVVKEDRRLLKALFHNPQAFRVQRFNMTMNKKDATFCYARTNARTIRDDSGSLKGFFALVTDLTEVRDAREERKRLVTAVEQTDESIFMTDVKGVIQYVNPAFEKMTGYSKQEILGKTPAVLKSGRHDKLFYKKLWDSLLGGNTWKGRFINKRKDGNLYETEATISPIVDSRGTIINFVSIKRDITQEVLMEKRLAQAQKMESIGTLAGGIAHDFNNILFPLIGYAELLKEDLARETAHHHYIVAILHAALRAKDLVSQILTFSRQAEGEIKPLRIYLVINEVLKLLRSTLPATIKIQSNLDSHCGLVAADPTQIHQVIMNLATNAFHAMETTGGSLGISLKQVTLDEDEPMMPELPAGEYAQLSVTDTGTGMDKTLLDKIFDPYFTTKEKSKGTGLGLSMVQGIVRQSKGGIRVYSEPGKGTTFQVYLPVVGSRDTGEPRKKPAPIQGGTESILLVDDEEPIIHMGQALLTRLGYHVTALTNGREALELFTASPEAFDLVISDMTMPGMTGMQLAGNMKAVRPDIPMILCTGFSRQVNGETAREMGIDGVVLKPLVKRDMAAIIRKVIGGN